MAMLAEFKLAQPVEVGGVHIDHVALRSVSPSDVAAMQRLNARAEVKAMKSVCWASGLTYAAIIAIHEVNPEFLSDVQAVLLPDWERAYRV